MALWGEPGAMIDGMYTLTTDDLTCNNAQYTVRSQQQFSYMNRSMVS